MTEWKPPRPFSSAPNLPVFPVSAFPSWLRSEVEALAEAVQVPVDLPAMIALSVLSTACSHKVEVSAHATYKEGTNLYVAVATNPGTGKTPVFVPLVRPLRAAERALQDLTRSEVAKASTRRDVCVKRINRLRDEAAKLDDPVERAAKVDEAAQLEAELASLPSGMKPRLLADDATPEQLATLLWEQSGRLAVLSDEGAVFGHMQGRYASNGPKEIPSVYLKAHTGGNLLIDRRGRCEQIDSAHLTIGVAVQPAVLQRIGRDDAMQGQGMVARFLMAIPECNVGHRNFVTAKPMPYEVDFVYQEKVTALTVALAVQDEPLRLRISAEALAAFQQFQLAHEPRLALGGDLHSVQDWGSKLPGHVLRLAGLLHMAEGGADCDREVSVETVRAAIEVGLYLAPHYLVVSELMGEGEVVAVARRILDWVQLKQPTEFSKRDLFRTVRSSKIVRSQDLTEPLALLVERGWLLPVAPPERNKSKGGQPPSPKFQPHPSLLRTALQAANAAA